MANPTLLEVAKRLNPKGKIAKVAELLTQTNDVLMDMTSMEGNLETGHRCTIRTGLPTVYYRAINQGILPSKSTTVQVDEGLAMTEGRSEIDVDLADLGDNRNALRFSEALAFIESMNQTIATGLFYGNPAVDPKQFLGLTQRYSDTSAGNAQNILSANGTTSLQQTSVWLVCWGPQTCFTIYPKGSKAGLSRKNLGEQTAYEFGGTGFRAQVYSELFKWKIGLVVKDWRSVVRICNVDTSEFAALLTTGGGGSGGVDPTSTQNLLHQMIRAADRVPNGVKRMSRPTWYMNQSTYSVLRRLALEKSHQALAIEPAKDQFGNTFRMLSFDGIPIRQADAIVNTEAQVL